MEQRAKSALIKISIANYFVDFAGGPGNVLRSRVGRCSLLRDLSGGGDEASEALAKTAVALVSAAFASAAVATGGEAAACSAACTATNWRTVFAPNMAAALLRNTH